MISEGEVLQLNLTAKIANPERLWRGSLQPIAPGEPLSGPIVRTQSNVYIQVLGFKQTRNPSVANSHSDAFSGKSQQNIS